jgi:hypothetical protein
MPSTARATFVEVARASAHRLTGTAPDYDPGLDLVGHARLGV